MLNGRFQKIIFIHKFLGKFVIRHVLVNAGQNVNAVLNISFISVNVLSKLLFLLPFDDFQELLQVSNLNLQRLYSREWNHLHGGY